MSGRIWQFVGENLTAGTPVAVLCVLDSQGSSPGRRGFKMAVTADGRMAGTVGGGIMEHKWVEFAKEKINSKNFDIEIKKQYHDKDHKENRSGMICSGEQTIAIFVLGAAHGKMLDSLIEFQTRNQTCIFELSPSGISFSPLTGNHEKDRFLFKFEDDWSYREILNTKEHVHIFGGGHVGLALSKILSMLGFYIEIYDDRPGLNTWESNDTANQKHLIDYDSVKDIPFRENDYIVLVTFSYRSDKFLLEQFMDKKVKYIGMMGSENKIRTLYRELEEEGRNPSEWAHVHAPIGMEIYSKTTMEIAVSIAGQMIKIKNGDLPHGRSY